MITNNLLFLFIGGICVFLMGTNLAFVIELRNKLAGWFSTMLIGGSLLLAYTGLSVLVGNPSMWRACIAFAAVSIDMLAFFWMYTNVQNLHRSGRVGMIPLAKFADDPADN